MDNIKTIDPSERRQYVPSDVMSLAQYTAFKQAFNERLPKENEKIRSENIKAKEVGQPQSRELELYPMETVTMLVPNVCILTLVDYKRIQIPKGIVEVPVELAENWYLKAHKAEKYNPMAQEIPVETESKKSVPNFKRGK